MTSGHGFVNAHTHLYSGLAPLGMPAPKVAPERFTQILERVWWRLDRALDADTLRASARLYVAEALLAGTTTVVDHHESPAFIEGSLDVLADACQDLGMRAVLCYGATERNGGPEEARRGLRECERFLRENDRPLVRGLVGMHAPFTVRDETIREAGDLCRRCDVPLHIHVAEATVDVEDARSRGYEGPLERLLALDGLPAGSILAHGVHLDASQVRVAAQRGCWLIQNPRSNRGNQVGYPKSLRAIERVALGTDGYPADMREEAWALEREAVEHGDDLEKSRQRLAMGEHLVAERFGGFDPDEDTVVFEEDRVVRSTVAGREVVREAKLVSADLEEICEEARQQAARLWVRMESL